MSDLSTLTPVKKPPFVPSTFRSRRLESIRYTREWPYGRVYRLGGGRRISEYGRSYPLPETLTELRLAKGVRSPAYIDRRLNNPNGNLKLWLMDHWRFIAVGVGVIVVIGAFLQKSKV